MQESVLVEADIDERGLETGQDVVDLALVDVSDYRSASTALDIELGHVVAVQLLPLLLGVLRASPAPSAGRLLITRAVPR